MKRTKISMCAWLMMGAATAEAATFQGNLPVYRAEIAEISGEGLMTCGALERSLRDADRAMNQLRELTVELNRRMESDAEDPRIERIIDRMALLKRQFDAVVPAKQLMPTVKVHFLAEVPTLWPKEYSDTDGRITDTIDLKEMMLPDPDADAEGPLHSVPKQVTGGNNYFTNPDKTLEFPFTRYFSLQELCLGQPRLRLSVKRRAHNYYGTQTTRVERDSIIEASYARVHKAIREALEKQAAPIR